MNELSFRTRENSLRRFSEEEFDLLIVGGGITGAATARDAVSRGLKVAVVEKNDFAWGTSSRSSKLIHGGLRYLENLEFHLVFEALSERAFLLKTAPHLVRPLPFYLPVYENDVHGRGILSLGLWLYDLLALFRTPGFHRRLSRSDMKKEIPFLQDERLLGGFQYYDASMWDDVLAIETLRAAHAEGAAVANYVEAVAPAWTEGRITGFRIRDRERPLGQGEIDLKAKRVILCTGPWTDLLGEALSPGWRHRLSPSKGVHLVFDLKRLPVPGALVMNHPDDGRISFVIPRKDLGAGVVIVGTTDGPSPAEPEKASIEPEDIRYLLALLNRYFPGLELTDSDILSAYVGVRPLVGGNGSNEKALQKVSREHSIELGPGGVTVVAGGKYTTHRKMAEEIVDFTLKAWRRDAKVHATAPVPSQLRPSGTAVAVNPRATLEAIEKAKSRALEQGIKVPEELFQRYGAEALDILEIHSSLHGGDDTLDPEGFPLLASQLRYLMRNSMVLHLEDFFFRRLPLHAARADHGLPWAERLSYVWAEERGASRPDARAELEQLRAEIQRRNAWKNRISE